MTASVFDADKIDLERLSFTLLLRGLFVIPLAAVAVRWPEPTLVLATVAAGGVIGTLGVFELAAGVVSGTPPGTRWFFLGHGVVSVAFGVLTASAPVASPDIAAMLAAGWLALNAAFALALAARRWASWRERLAILVWSGVNALCALALVIAPPAGTFALLYAGAAYMFLLGVVQLVAAAWIRRRAADEG